MKKKFDLNDEKLDLRNQTIYKKILDSFGRIKFNKSFFKNIKEVLSVIDKSANKIIKSNQLNLSKLEALKKASQSLIFEGLEGIKSSKEALNFSYPVGIDGHSNILTIDMLINNDDEDNIKFFLSTYKYREKEV